MMVIVMMVVVRFVSGRARHGWPLGFWKHTWRKSNRACGLAISTRRRPRSRLFGILDGDTALAAELVTFTVLIAADPTRDNFRVGSRIVRQIRPRILDIRLARPGGGGAAGCRG